MSDPRQNNSVKAVIQSYIHLSHHTRKNKPKTEDKATQYDLQEASQAALYAELLETTEAKVNIMLKLYGSYDKILEKLEHRLNKK